jgi:hypothetical protein
MTGQPSHDKSYSIQLPFQVLGSSSLSVQYGGGHKSSIFVSDMTGKGMEIDGNSKTKLIKRFSVL